MAATAFEKEICLGVMISNDIGKAKKQLCKISHEKVSIKCFLSLKRTAAVALGSQYNSFWF